MQERRLSKIARLVQKELAELFRENTQANARGVIISVTNVRPTPDLSQCKVYLSIFPSNKSEEILNEIKQKKSVIRGDLGRRLASQLRVIPDLIFFLDDSLDYIDHIDELLGKKTSK